MVRTVEINPNLAAAAFHAKQTKYLRMWLRMRLLDEKHEGTIPVDAVHAAEKAAGRDRTTTYRALKEGEGIWWHTFYSEKNQEWRFKIVGFKDIFNRIYRPTSDVEKKFRSVIITEETVNLRMGAFRAHIYASRFGAEAETLDENGPAAPISRRTLRKLSGVSERSQQRYDQKADVIKQENYVPLPELPVEPNMVLPEDMRAYRVRMYEGKPCLMRQLPNSYAYLAPLAPSKKTKAQIEEVAGSRRIAPFRVKHAAAYSLKGRRVYYRDWTSAMRRSLTTTTYTFDRADDGRSYWRENLPVVERKWVID